MKQRALGLLVAAALLLSTGRAFAEEDEGARFRMGGFIGGGAFIAPSAVRLVAGNGGCHAGVLFNKLLGLHAHVDLLQTFGKVKATSLGGALTVELTLGDRFMVGGGPELLWYEADEGNESVVPSRYNFLYGGKLRFAWAVFVGPRVPLSGNLFFSQVQYVLSLDARLLGGGAFFARGSRAPEPDSRSDLAFVPTLTFGLQATR